MEMSLAEMDEMLLLREGQSDRVADEIRLAAVMAARAATASHSATTSRMKKKDLGAMASSASENSAMSSSCRVHIYQWRTLGCIHETLESMRVYFTQMQPSEISKTPQPYDKDLTSSTSHYTVLTPSELKCKVVHQ
jgi:hypothetical protein